jgi:predicted acyltransferase
MHRLASVGALLGCTIASMPLFNDSGYGDRVHWPLEHAP